MLSDRSELRLAEVWFQLEFGISMANLLRAHGGCLGVKSEKGVEVCEMPGGVDKQAMIPGFPTATC